MGRITLFSRKSALFAVTFIIALILGLMILAGNLSAATSSVTYTVNSIWLHRDVITSYINRDRQGGDGYWVDSTGTHRVGKIYELSTDSDLDQIALRRAAEIAFSYSYTRPDRTSFSTCRVNGMYTEQEYIYKTRAIFLIRNFMITFSMWEEALLRLP